MKERAGREPHRRSSPIEPPMSPFQFSFSPPRISDRRTIPTRRPSWSDRGPAAPFRAFLQEREAHGAKGKNWLFFGEQHQVSDFYYRDELERWTRSGHLTRLDLAFSRIRSLRKRPGSCNCCKTGRWTRLGRAISYASRLPDIRLGWPERIRLPLFFMRDAVSGWEPRPFARTGLAWR